MRMRISITHVRGKWPPVYYTYGRTTEGVLDLRNKAVSEKILLPTLPVEYVTSISGRTDASEVRCAGA